MLVYERREKRPVKVLVEKDSEGAIHDADKDEHYKLLPFKEASKATG